jgi:hypothetical protein
MILVNVAGEYKYNDGTNWVSLGATVTDQQYITYGMTATQLSNITDIQWAQLSGIIDISYFTTDAAVVETIFSIETDPFSFYDEMGNFDVLYYTDDAAKTTANLNLNENYSPLDDIAEDFDLVVYAPLGLKNVQNKVDYTAIPLEQLILNASDILYEGDLQRIVATKTTTSNSEGVMRFIASFDGGVTWKSYKGQNWIVVDTNAKNSMKLNGMTFNELNNIPVSEFAKQGTKNIRLGYYLDEATHKLQDTKINMVKAVSKEALNDVKVNSMAFYLLNTTATINVTFGGNKLAGSLDDADKTRVRYRVKLNDIPYYPENGSFSTLQDAPYNIQIVIDDRKVRFGQQNTLVVEFEDSWGQTDSWQTTFVGTYSGLLFSDETGSFYSTGFGDVLKNMDFGQIIAGQTTLEQRVLVKNLLGYDIQNVTLEAIQPQLSGVEIQMSKLQAPFIPLSSLSYPELLVPDDFIEFYVRISTTLTAQESPSGKFEVRVNADRVN